MGQEYEANIQVLKFREGGSETVKGGQLQQPNWFLGEPIWLLFWFQGGAFWGGGGTKFGMTGPCMYSFTYSLIAIFKKGISAGSMLRGEPNL